MSICVAVANHGRRGGSKHAHKVRLSLGDLLGRSRPPVREARRLVLEGRELPCGEARCPFEVFLRALKLNRRLGEALQRLADPECHCLHRGAGDRDRLKVTRSPLEFLKRHAEL
jgi:hypothetical protein